MNEIGTQDQDFEIYECICIKLRNITTSHWAAFGNRIIALICHVVEHMANMDGTVWIMQSMHYSIHNTDRLVFGIRNTEGSSSRI